MPPTGWAFLTSTVAGPEEVVLEEPLLDRTMPATTTTTTARPIRTKRELRLIGSTFCGFGEDGAKPGRARRPGLRQAAMGRTAPAGGGRLAIARATSRPPRSMVRGRLRGA